MQRKDGPPHPGAVLPEHIQTLAEKQKLQHRPPYKQESTNPFHQAIIRDQMDPYCKKSCHAEHLPLRGRTSIMLQVMERKRKTEDKKTALLCKTLLWGISCFDSEQAFR